MLTSYEPLSIPFMQNLISPLLNQAYTKLKDLIKIIDPFSKPTHTWVATSELLTKINQTIASDPYLKKYAQPDEETKQRGQADAERVGIDAKTEIPDTGGFQIISNFIKDLTKVKLPTTIMENSIYSQQRAICKNGSNTPSQMWFACETWWMVDHDATIYFKYGDDLICVKSEEEQVRNILILALHQSATALTKKKTFLPFDERMQLFQESFKKNLETIDPVILQQSNLLQRLASTKNTRQITPICSFKGHGELQNNNGSKQFVLTELIVDYFGSYRYNSLIDWILRKPAYDLRPELITKPTESTYTKRAYLKHDCTDHKWKVWWCYAKTYADTYIRNLHFMRQQLKNQYLWSLAKLIVIIALVTLLVLVTYKLTLLQLCASKMASTLCSLYVLIAMAITSNTAQNNSKTLETLPVKQQSTHASDYVGSRKGNTNDTDYESDEEVVIELNDPDSPIGRAYD